MIFGVVFVLTGIVWFLQSIGWVDDTIWNLYLPLVLVVVGLSILFHSQENECIMCRLWDAGDKDIKDIKKDIKPAYVPPVVPKKEKVETKKVVAKSAAKSKKKVAAK
jgi:hypothetical protein